MSSVERLMDDRCEPLSRLAQGRYSDGFLRAIDAALAVRPAGPAAGRGRSSARCSTQRRRSRHAGRSGSAAEPEPSRRAGGGYRPCRAPDAELATQVPARTVAPAATAAGRCRRAATAPTPPRAGRSRRRRPLPPRRRRRSPVRAARRSAVAAGGGAGRPGARRRPSPGFASRWSCSGWRSAPTDLQPSERVRAGAAGGVIRAGAAARARTGAGAGARAASSRRRPRRRSAVAESPRLPRAAAPAPARRPSRRAGTGRRARREPPTPAAAAPTPRRARRRPRREPPRRVAPAPAARPRSRRPRPDDGTATGGRRTVQ